MDYKENSDIKNYDRSDVVQLQTQQLKSRNASRENRKLLDGRAVDGKFNDMRF